MATRPERKLTFDDYVHFPEGERWELINGEAYVVPSPNTRHQEILIELTRQIANHVRQRGGGRVFAAPFDVVLDDPDVVQPDIVFIADEDLGVLTEANVRGTPSWVIEVLSPSHPERDRKLKLSRYERFGIPEYWIVDPEAHVVEVFRLESGRYGEAMRAAPPGGLRPSRPSGLEINLDDVFRRVD